MIYHIKGNLLTSDCNIIGHQANCQKTMGSGIALSIKKLMPEAYEADKKFPYSSKERLGKCSVGKSIKHKKFIFNLYGQEFYGWTKKKYTNDDALRSALESMFLQIKEIEEKYPKFQAKIGFPYKMGCDRAGGDWNTVSAMIEEIANKHKRDVYIYEYNPKNK